MALEVVNILGLIYVYMKSVELAHNISAQTIRVSARYTRNVSQACFRALLL